MGHAEPSHQPHGERATVSSVFRTHLQPTLGGRCRSACWASGDEAYCEATGTVHNPCPAHPLAQPRIGHERDRKMNEERTMGVKSRLYLTVAAMGIATFVSAALAILRARSGV